MGYVSLKEKSLKTYIKTILVNTSSNTIHFCRYKIIILD